MTTRALKYLPFDMQEVIIKKLYTHHILVEMRTQRVTKQITLSAAVLKNYVNIMDGRIHDLLKELRSTNEDIPFNSKLQRLRNVREKWKTKLNLVQMK